MILMNLTIFVLTIFPVQKALMLSAGNFATLSVANCDSAFHLNTMRDSE